MLTAVSVHGSLEVAWTVDYCNAVLYGVPAKVTRGGSLIVFVVKDQDILMTSLCQFTTLEIVLELRSADHGGMGGPLSRPVRYGKCSFRFSAPSMWNDIPSEL